MVAGYSIFLNQASDSGDGAEAVSSAPLHLPDKLPNGFVATDLAAAFAGSQLKSQADTISTTEGRNQTYADKSITSVLGVPGVSRTYVSPDLSSGATVQAVRAPGGAFAPTSLGDPALAQAGQQVSRFVRQGDAVCTLTWFPAAQGQAADTSGTPGSAACQRGGDALTVTITLASASAAAAVTQLDAVYADLSGS